MALNTSHPDRRGMLQIHRRHRPLSQLTRRHHHIRTPEAVHELAARFGNTAVPVIAEIDVTAGFASPSNLIPALPARLAYIRRSLTASGATQVQVAEYRGGREEILEHVGSAHTQVELGVLLARARELLVPAGTDCATSNSVARPGLTSGTGTRRISQPGSSCP